MKKEKLGDITADECEKLKAIYLRKSALEELLISLDTTDKSGNLYERIMSDLIECKKSMSEWWNDVSSRNGWDYGPEYRWEVQFNTREVFLYI